MRVWVRVHACLLGSYRNTGNRLPARWSVSINIRDVREAQVTNRKKREKIGEKEIKIRKENIILASHEAVNCVYQSGGLIDLEDNLND